MAISTEVTDIDRIMSQKSNESDNLYTTIHHVPVADVNGSNKH